VASPLPIAPPSQQPPLPTLQPPRNAQQLPIADSPDSADALTYLTVATTAATDCSAWYVWSTSNLMSTQKTTWLRWNDYYTTGNNSTALYTNAAVWREWNGLRRPADDWRSPSHRAMCERINREAAEARARARVLLEEHLTEEQRAVLSREKFFEVLSRDGRRRYRITHGRAGNVYLLGPDGRPVTRYCAHPVDRVPDEDTMLAQKLMLESCEEDFLRLANATPLRPAV
jgi:hypothetical protein